MSDKQEEEYFARLETEKKAKLAAQLGVESATEERDQLRTLHHHKCGKCGQDMETKPHRGVEIEVCPDCGAVLLDRGELETLAGEDHSGLLGGILSMFDKR